MKFGYICANDADGIRPDRLAVQLEERGFDSIWMPEHTHIPTSRVTPFPAGGDLPDGYSHIMDPLISLMAAGSATESILLYTGICLLLQHDVLALAAATATLDVLTNGRLRLGVGVGWNEEEFTDHRPDVEFRQRYSAMKERVSALRVAWSEERAAFGGRWDSFQESFIYPKPVAGSIPVSLGNAGPVGIRHAAEYADEWCPLDASMLNVDGRPNPSGAIDMFRRLATNAGRDPGSIPITIHAPVIHGGRFESYVELGVERIVLFPPTMNRMSEADTLGHLDDLADLVERFSD